MDRVSVGMMGVATGGLTYRMMCQPQRELFGVAAG